MLSLSCVMPIVFVLYFFRQVPLKWAVSCKAGLGHAFNHSSYLWSGGIFIHQIHNDQGGKEGNEKNVFVSVYWDHLDILLLLKKPHRGQGIWFLLSSCPDALEFSGYQPCTWLLSGLWCETISGGTKSEGGGGSVVCPHVLCPWVPVPAQGEAWGGRQLWR